MLAGLTVFFELPININRAREGHEILFPGDISFGG